MSKAKDDLIRDELKRMSTDISEIRANSEKIDIKLFNHLTHMAKDIGKIEGTMNTLKWVIPVVVGVATIFINLAFKLIG